jgi:hypothetical protein
MVNPLSWGRRNVLFLALPACLLSLVFTGPKDSTRLSQSRALQARSVQQPTPAAHVRQGRVHDWSMRHALYPQVGTMAALEAARSDPRSSFRWSELQEQRDATRFGFQQRNLQNLLQFRFPGRPGHFPIRNSKGDHIDWAINLGTNGTAIGMYPAKYTFDTTVAPSCANDFVVFPVNANGGAAQPNLVAFNQLYSGTAGGNGICNRAASGNDTGVAAQVMWSYDFEGMAAGTVPTSPVLSLDGKKVAFVESVAGTGAHFHVLAWRSGDGTVANKQSVLTPQTFGGGGSAFVATAPVASGASGAATDLSFGATGDTLSSPYIDYAADTAYVGNDAGVLFRLKNVFCTTASCGTAAPSLDTTFGSGTGSITVCSGKTMTGPVQDFYNLKIYVGCSDGKLYSINSAGTTVTSITVGNGTAVGGIVDPPLVDGINGFVYAVSGQTAGGTGVLVQAKVDFSSSVAVPIGNGGQCNVHAPTVNNAYFTSPVSANSLIYIGGVTGTVGPCTAGGATGGTNQLYAATFGAGGVLTAGAPAHALASGNTVGNEYAPLAEFFNTGTATDTIFVGILRNNTRGFNNLYTFNSTAGWNATPITSVLSGLGTSGMVVDNSSASNQASSIYFNSLNQNAACGSPPAGSTNGCATKLTQAALQ